MITSWVLDITNVDAFDRQWIERSGRSPIWTGKARRPGPIKKGASCDVWAM